MKDSESTTPASTYSVMNRWLELDGVQKNGKEGLQATSMRTSLERGISQGHAEGFQISRKPAKWAINLLIERLSYLLVLTPFFSNCVATGKLPASPLALSADVIVGLVILAFVLLMRQTRRRVEQVDGLRRTLNEAIIHDLKNPMTSIMGCISCMIDEHPDDKRQRRLLELALHSCRAQVTLIETLVDTSRLEHGELAPQAQPLNTRKMLDACLNSVTGTASSLGVNLKATISDSLPAELRGDPDLLPRVFSNLILNALKYTPKGGSVSLDASFKDGSFTFEVKDTGIGIGSVHIKRLFEKYYRVEGPDQNTRRGSGLGLYFCRLVVEAHGGKIDVKSAAGDGTRITFSIPQAPVHKGGQNDPRQEIRSFSEVGA